MSSSSYVNPGWRLSTFLLAAVIAVGGPLIIFGNDGENAEESAVQGAKKTTVSAGSDITGNSSYSDFVENSTGSQVTYLELDGEFRTGTATERFARPALSLSKLYIADYVLDNGTVEEKYAAVDMINSSSDISASELFEKYPEAVDVTADKYGLLSTRGAERWGYSVTSTYDVVKFIAALLREDPTSPILVAMAAADPVAADGYDQDWGTHVLPGVIGTKWGWSDDRLLHSSVSFGIDFVVAAAVTGDSEDLTRLVENQLGDIREGTAGGTAGD